MKTEKKTEKKTTKKAVKAAEPELEAVSTRALRFEKRLEELEDWSKTMKEATRETLFGLDTKTTALEKKMREAFGKTEKAIAELASQLATLRGDFDRSQNGARVQIAKPIGTTRSGAQLQQVRKVSSGSYREILRQKRSERNAPIPAPAADKKGEDR